MQILDEIDSNRFLFSFGLTSGSADFSSTGAKNKGTRLKCYNIYGGAIAQMVERSALAQLTSRS